MRKTLTLFLVSLFSIGPIYAQSLVPLSQSPEANFQPPFCYKKQNRDENATRKYTTVIRLYKATFKDVFDKNSVWDQDFLQDHPHVVEAIRDFQKGKRAQTLKKINLEGKTAEDLHKELLSLGFVWRTIPLRASFKKHTYWLVGGQTSKDQNREPPRGKPRGITSALPISSYACS